MRNFNSNQPISSPVQWPIITVRREIRSAQQNKLLNANLCSESSVVRSELRRLLRDFPAGDWSRCLIETAEANETRFRVEKSLPPRPYPLIVCNKYTLKETRHSKLIAFSSKSLIPYPQITFSLPNQWPQNSLLQAFHTFIAIYLSSHFECDEFHRNNHNHDWNPSDTSTSTKIPFRDG